MRPAALKVVQRILSTTSAFPRLAEDLKRQSGDAAIVQIALDPFLRPGVPVEHAVAQAAQGSDAAASLVLVSVRAPQLGPSGPAAGYVLLAASAQVPADVVHQVKRTFEKAPQLRDASHVRGVLLLDAGPSLTSSMVQKALGSAGLAQLARKPVTIVARGTPAAAAVQLLSSLAEPLPPLAPLAAPAPPSGPVRVAVARDEAFSPPFQENLQTLAAAGAQLAFFSPLYDPVLPAGASLLILSGRPAEPERWQQLAANRPLLAAVRAHCGAGGLVLAEGAGLLYLSRSVETQDDEAHEPLTHELGEPLRALRACTAASAASAGC
jgi:hypothetical protein